MKSEDKDLIEEALRSQRPHERYNKALSRTVSEKMDGRQGYKRYLNLIREIRDTAEEEGCSIEEAVKKILGKK